VKHYIYTASIFLNPVFILQVTYSGNTVDHGAHSTGLQTAFNWHSDPRYGIYVNLLFEY